jgi:hypothetical protein
VLKYNQADLAPGAEAETPVAQVLKYKFRNTSEEGVLHI